MLQEHLHRLQGYQGVSIKGRYWDLSGLIASLGEILEYFVLLLL